MRILKRRILPILVASLCLALTGCFSGAGKDIPQRAASTESASVNPEETKCPASVQRFCRTVPFEGRVYRYAALVPEQGRSGVGSQGGLLLDFGGPGVPLFSFLDAGE